LDRQNLRLPFELVLLQSLLPFVRLLPVPVLLPWHVWDLTLYDVQAITIKALFN
jgi:hypothetical protein